ncbi:MAG TPA: ABC transporter ATP-binding protein [Bacillota bacterium]|nr:ABC transporter ATP-binding protein [Bacillota bacterium]
MIIHVKDLVKRYGDLIALDHLSLDIQEGEVFGLLGPNGSGKTTAINCMLSLLAYDKGEIEIFGKPMTPSSYASKRDIGVVMQNVAVIDELTVLENVDFFCGLYIKDNKERKALVDEAIEMVGLNDFRKFYPKKLSGGLLRRLNIACGIAHKPKLIFFDEPTVAVDPQSRNNILEGIKNLNKSGATIIYTSHYMEEVEHLCNRIAIMDNGQIIAQGTKQELIDMVRIGEKISIELLLSNPEDVLPWVKEMEFVSSAKIKEGMLVVKAKQETNAMSKLLDELGKRDIKTGRIFGERPSLNDVFLEITGKELRDA